MKSTSTLNNGSVTGVGHGACTGCSYPGTRMKRAGRNLRTHLWAQAVLLSCLLAVSCNKNEVAHMEGQDADVTVSIQTSFPTRVQITDEIAANEAKVNNLQVFLFREDGSLDAYGSAVGQTKMKLSCTKGEREVWAVVNAPALSGISTLGELKDTKTLFADNDTTSFVMTGSSSEKIDGDRTVAVDVSRMASRILVRKISNKMASQVYRDMTFRVDSVFVINVQAANNYGSTALQDSDGEWTNKQGFTATDPHLIAITLSKGDEVVQYGRESTRGYAVYAYPNDYQEQPDEEIPSAWSKRATRLVVKVYLGQTPYYYPVTLPPLESNKSYEINNLIITRPGSDHPDHPVTSFEVDVEVTVIDWTTVLITGEKDTPGSGDYTI